MDCFFKIILDLRGESMGKHKHRRRDRDSEYVQQPMNQGYNNVNMGMNPGQMGGQNQYMQNGMNQGMNMNNLGQGMNPNMDSGMNNMGMNNMGMNQNMNPMNMMGNNMMNNPLLGLLGSLGGLGGGNPGGGPDMNGIMQMLNGFGGGNPSGGPDMNGIMQMLNGFGLGMDPSMANLLGGAMGGNGGNFDIMQMLGGLLGGLGGTNTAPAQSQVNNETPTSSSFDELLTQISPEQMRTIQGILQGLGMNSFQQQSTSTQYQTEKKDDSLEEILANLDFNSILNNLDNQSFFGMDFTNINGDILEDIDVEDIVNGAETDEDMGEVRDADIVEENILNKEKELTKDEYRKLINVLIKLIDPNKIRLLQKVFNEYEKRVESK